MLECFFPQNVLISNENLENLEYFIHYFFHISEIFVNYH